jgi:hypothetical protein
MFFFIIVCPFSSCYGNDLRLLITPIVSSNFSYEKLGFEIDIENILFGNASFVNDNNSKLFLLSQKYIINLKIFVW